MTTLQTWRRNPTLAHVLPLFVFLGFTQLAAAIKIDNSLLPWFRHAPEHWVYPLQCLVCGALLWFFWRHYPMQPRRGFGFATVAGLLGIAIWILPTAIFDWLHWDDETTAPWLRWLGFQEREDSGFNPGIFGDSPLAYGSTIALRFARAVLIVPLIEEIFWRGFLMRYLMNMDGDFTKTPLGAYRWWTVAITTALVMVAHQPADYFAAVIWGLLMAWVFIRTKSLAACVWGHAVANFILCVYVLASGNRGLW